MPSAEKRRRQKDNTARAREAREAAEKRERRRKTAIRVGVIAALAIGGVALLNVLSGDDGDDVAASDTTTASTSDTTGGPTTTTEPFVPTDCNDETPGDVAEKPTFEAPEQVIDTSKTYTATIETSCGTIVADLDVANAPDGVNNFVFLANEGFYDGLTWHRVVPDFVIQGGDPTGQGAGGPGYDVVTETPDSDFQLGDLAYAKAPTAANGTSGSQFFVVTGDPAPLNVKVEGEYQYGRFGHVTEGLDVARTIESFNQGDGPPTRSLYVFSVEITES